MQPAVNSQEKLDIINVVHSNENFPCKKWLKTLHLCQIKTWATALSM